MEKEERPSPPKPSSDHLREGEKNRWDYVLPVEYRPSGKRKSSPGITKNIGEDGILLSLNEGMAPGEQIALSLFIDDGIDFRAIDLLAEVVGTGPECEKERGWGVEVKYVSMSSENRNHLKKFLNAVKSIPSAFVPGRPASGRQGGKSQSK